MKYLIKNENWNVVEDYNLDKLLYLLIDRPDHVDTWNNFCWDRNGRKGFRNYDLPALVYFDMELDWRVNQRPNNKAVKIYST